MRLFSSLSPKPAFSINLAFRMPITHLDMVFKHSHFVLKTVPFLIWDIERNDLRSELIDNLKPEIGILKRGLSRLIAGLSKQSGEIVAETSRNYLRKETACCGEFADMLMAVSAFLEYPGDVSSDARASLYL